MDDVQSRNPTNQRSSQNRLSRCQTRRLLIRRRRAAAYCDMGLSTFDRADAAGLIPAARKVGGCKLWCVEELNAWAALGCPSRSEWVTMWDSILAARRIGSRS